MIPGINEVVKINIYISLSASSQTVMVTALDEVTTLYDGLLILAHRPRTLRMEIPGVS